MNHVKVYTRTYRDNSARYIELPALLIEQNGETKIFEQLLNGSKSITPFHGQLRGLS